jgi:hypothetical protein
MRPLKLLIRPLLIASACTLQVLGASAASSEPAPNARDILEAVRMRQAQQQIDLHGQLRENEVVVPFQLIQSGSIVRYIFSNPNQSLQLQLGENDSRLDEITKEGIEKVKPAQFDSKVRGTELTYEDLALKFLYWPQPRLLGSENVRTRSCWMLELKPPNKQSQYSRVVLWVDKASGALMRLEGYDWKSQLTKRFEVVSAQKIEDRWFLKQMRIETLQPGTTHVTSRMYLEINKT